jgi:hypothetical protein
MCCCHSNLSLVNHYFALQYWQARAKILRSSKVGSTGVSSQKGSSKGVSSASLSSAQSSGVE